MPLFGAPNIEHLQARGRVKALIKTLDYKPDLEVRRAAAIALGELGDSAAVEALIAALQGRELRQEAADALGRIGDVRAVEALLVALRDADLEVRTAAATALGEIGDRRASPALIEAFADGEYVVREAVVAALRRMGAETEGLLHAALSDPSRAIREGAMRALDAREWTPTQDAAGAHYWILKEEWDKVVELGAEAVEPLIQALEDEGSTIEAARALARLGDARAVQPLTLLAQDSRAEARQETAKALGAIGDPGALATLLHLLEDEQDTVRQAAADALGEVGDPMAVQYLLDARHDETWRVRQAIMEALGALGDPRAVEPLVAAFGDEHPSVRLAAEEALRKIDAPVEGLLIAALTDPQRVARDRAARALDERKWEPTPDAAGAAYHIVRRHWDKLPPLGVAALQPLLLALDDTWVSDGVISSLVAIGEPAVEPLIGRLDDTELAGRKAIVESLGKIGDPRAVQPLIGLLSTDEPVRGLAAQALGLVGAAAVEPLLALLKSDEAAQDDGLRQAAALALTKAGAPAVAPLVELLGNENLGEAASETLVEIGAPAVAPLLEALRDETRTQAAIETLARLKPEGIEQLVASIRGRDDWTPEDVARLWQVAARISDAERWVLLSKGLRQAFGPADSGAAPPKHVALVGRLLSHDGGEREAAALQVEGMADLSEAGALARAYRANRLLAEALGLTDGAADGKRALLYAHEALRLAPDFSAALVTMATLYREHAKRPDLALGWVMQALGLVDEEAELGAEEDNPRAWVELGEVRVALGDPLAATAAYLGATLVGPDLADPQPHLRLIQVYKRLGMLEELYAAMDVARRLGADLEADLDPAWDDLLAQVEVSALKEVVAGLGEQEEQGMAADSGARPLGAASQSIWDDSHHV